MSNYFLCDRCALKFGERGLPTTMTTCVSLPTLHPKLVMYDHHGFNGLRYRNPSEVCSDYKPMGK